MAAMTEEKELFDEHTVEIGNLFSVKGRIALITGGELFRIGIGLSYPQHILSSGGLYIF